MKRFVASIFSSVALLLCAATGLCGKDEKLVSKPAANDPTVEFQGKLVAPTTPRETLKFKTESGSTYALISNRLSSALFIDTNLQSKVLLLKGRVSPKTRSFEVTGNFRSVRDGKIYDLYYYCDVCAIKGSEPGLCMCCREPVHLVEEPAIDGW